MVNGFNFKIAEYNSEIPEQKTNCCAKVIAQLHGYAALLPCIYLFNSVYCPFTS